MYIIQNSVQLIPVIDEIVGDDQFPAFFRYWRKNGSTMTEDGRYS
jgi:hypothetical protein